MRAGASARKSLRVASGVRAHERERANACARERANVPEPRDGVRAHKRVRGCMSVCDRAGVCARARARGCARVERTRVRPHELGCDGVRAREGGLIY